MQYIISIDGFKQANDYTRWRSEWNTVINNAHKLQNNGHKIHFNTTLSLYTVFDYHKLVQFLQAEFPDCLIHGQYADGYSPFVFNYSQDQIDNLGSICNTKIYADNQLFRSFIDGTINSAKQSQTDVESLSKFFIYNDRLDGSRNSVLNNYIPALENLRFYVDK